MAEIVDSEAAPVDTSTPEGRLDDNDRRKLIDRFLQGETNFVGHIPEIVEESSERTKRNRLKGPRGALSFQLHIRRASRSMEKSEGMYFSCILLSAAALTRHPPYCWPKC